MLALGFSRFVLEMMVYGFRCLLLKDFIDPNKDSPSNPPSAFFIGGSVPRDREHYDKDFSWHQLGYRAVGLHFHLGGFKNS